MDVHVWLPSMEKILLIREDDLFVTRTTVFLEAIPLCDYQDYQSWSKCCLFKYLFIVSNLSGATVSIRIHFIYKVNHNRTRLSIESTFRPL